jgi:hypothetical protein
MFYPEGSNRSIVPAHPGWYVVWPWHEPPRARGVTCDNVIAWLIVHSTAEFAENHTNARRPDDEKICHVDCYPITTDGIVGDVGDAVVLKDPCGRFIRINDRIYDNEEEFLDDWERRTAEEKTGAVKLVPK